MMMVQCNVCEDNLVERADGITAILKTMVLFEGKHYCSQCYSHIRDLKHKHHCPKEHKLVAKV